MEPTEVLVSEHEIVEEMLGLLHLAAEQLDAGHPVDPEVFGKAIEFLRGFVDQCHHAKEERHLFPALVRKGVPEQGGPVGVMLAEHEQGRAHVRAMAEAVAQPRAGRANARQDLVKHARAYVDLLEAHIGKENGVLFPLADRMLGPSDNEELARQFDKVEAEEMGAGVHERYHKLVAEVRAGLGGSGKPAQHHRH